jgi:hypothetical protein
MNIWHGTDDTPRTPRRANPTEHIVVTVGTWPIEPGQSVWVTWDVVAADDSGSEGMSAAQWQRNAGTNSYWTAQLGPFADGDQMTYVIHGTSDDGTVHTSAFSARIRPLYIAWLWHQHQPLYRDPTTPTDAGSYRYPWVRLHALRDYYSMAALAAEHDIHVTFNLTSEQIARAA